MYRYKGPKGVPDYYNGANILAKSGNSTKKTEPPTRTTQFRGDKFNLQQTVGKPMSVMFTTVGNVVKFVMRVESTVVGR